MSGCDVGWMGSVWQGCGVGVGSLGWADWLMLLTVQTRVLHDCLELACLVDEPVDLAPRSDQISVLLPNRSLSQLHVVDLLGVVQRRYAMWWEVGREGGERGVCVV